ncbi:EEV glycoprotein [Deerpox virus W-848-83]|uniref:Protein OPG161 n=1 Tax=Deerpox virus (strain Mule deer/United States/W-848-83/1983) TaxID=305674 RepID=Q08FM0_DPV83|nr:EEV glycoprotein [Deerpox virus W-848-83]ABI99287.1 EEV glycoprotein [Deerpox virus W-848-83]
MTTVEITMEEGNDKKDVTETANSFVGSTIYGPKLKKTKSKKSKWLSICLRVLVISSILSLMAVATTLALQYSKCKAEYDSITNKQSLDSYSLVTPDKLDPRFECKECQGIMFDGDCYQFNTEHKTFSEASMDCAGKGYSLPATNLMSKWIGDYLESTWGEEGYGLSKERGGNIESPDASTEKRNYFCVKSVS